MTATLEGGEWSAARPGRTLTTGNTRCPFYMRLGGPQGRSWRAEKLIPTGIRSRTVQPIVSSYTDWATRPTNMTWYVMENKNKSNITSTCFGRTGPCSGRTCKVNSRNHLNFTLKIFVLVQLTDYKVHLQTATLSRSTWNLPLFQVSNVLI